MIVLPGYNIKEKIYSGEKTIVYRAANGNKPVIIKVLHNDYPSTAELNAFKQEYKLLQNLTGKGIVKSLGTEKYKNSFAIIFEDIGAVALSILLKEKGKYSLSEAITIAIKVANALGEIHNANIVHRDIKPHNIVLNENTGNLNIIDFGTASLLAKQNAFIPLTSSLEGTLAYISPEQTGRMNRSVDYRTDFYSLGITLYQILTGDLPFLYSDPMELVHAHIAKSPLTPFERNGTPKVISDIIMKLLEKDPGDRYQSIIGLVYDLEWCLKNINSLVPDHLQDNDYWLNSFFGNSINFEIGSRDIVGKFQIPEKLYGRTKEVLRIVKSYKRVSEGNTELLIISGRSGIGKSALVNEISKSLVEQKGYFASGRYDQFSKSIPHKAITQSFNSLIGQIVMEGQASILHWKEMILAELADNGKIIIDIIPELETLIGKQPEVAELPPTESQNRFSIVFRKFINAICKKEHPIVIFLDDLQWADSASLNLIQSILSDLDLKYFLFILAFRHNEVQPDHQFSIMIREWLKNVILYKPILLEPISKFDVNYLVTDTLGRSDEDCKELVDILYDKTQGNPFFVKEVFKNLYSKGYIYFAGGIWQWDIDLIRSVIRVSENVVNLMVEKIMALPERSIAIMKLAACIGDWFRISVFADILNLSYEDALEELRIIANDGFMIMKEPSVGFVQAEVREAVYIMLSPEEKSLNHYKIGCLYLRNANDDDLDSQVYTIVEQLNHGIMHIIQPKERNRLLDLNILMGNKSLTISDNYSANQFFKKAMQLLPDNPWEDNYNKTLDLYSATALSEYLTTNFSEADRLYEIIYQNCKSLFDKIPVVHTQLRQKATEGKGDEAFRIGFQVLNELGLKMPNPFEAGEVNNAFFRQLGKYEELLGERQILDLLYFPEMEDRNSRQALSLITNLGDIAIALRPDLLALISIQGVTLSLEFGNAKESSISYMMWGIITNLIFKDYKTGYELGKLSLALNQEKFPDELIYGKAYAFYGWNINHWVKPVKEDLEIAKKGYKLAMANSDLVFAGYFILIPVKASFFIGLNLEELLELISKALEFSEKFKFKIGAGLVFPTLFFSLALQGKTENLFSFKSESYDDEVYLNNYESIGQAMAYFYLRKFQLYYIANEYEKCLEILPTVENYFPNIPQHIGFCEFHFFNALLLIGQVNNLFEEKKYAEKFKESYEYLKLWSGLCGENFLHKFLLVEAEKAKVENRVLDAIDFYDRAIEYALANEYINDVAIACELAGIFFVFIGKPKLAQVYITDAQYYFAKWGAVAKVKQLEEKYPELKKQTKNYFYRDTTISTNTHANITTIGTNPGTNFLDLNTVMKAAQTISSEIQLGKLLESMMGILLENAGAQRGFVILKEHEKWYIEAEGNLDTVSVLKAIPLDGYSELSSKIVNYVIHTKSIIILNDAVNSGIFVNDSYVKLNKPKSILCFPIINQGNAIGIVYLENNLVTDAFTGDRLETLKILSSQIAVSIENSLLYSSLEAKVEERTQDLSKAVNNINSLLKEVTTLKENQDADYFLTSLLALPFSKNKAISENVKVDFFISQKKKFTFRNNEYELGGDVNVSDTIQLLGRKYIVFLNGDAMGKSIQGAGGVLVLGTVLKSIIQRTKSISLGNSYYPERWLKNAFIEIHNAFEGFEGSMLMSLILGLVDEVRGTMYFINADHPDMVIYRNEKAEYIYNYRRFKKIGAKGQTGVISISLFQMYPGDILILGSDGRDDLVLNTTQANGSDIRNMDADVFLGIVKDAKGDLPSIYERIASHGKIIDDLSLIRISFKENSGQLNGNSSNLDSILSLMENSKDTQDFEKYCDLGQKLILEEPYESKCLLHLVKVLTENKQYEKVIDFGERMRLREPENLDNLAMLIESYIEIGRKERAWDLFNQLEVDPFDEKFQELENKLRG